MASFNNAQILGNITKEPEIKTLPSGNKVASFSIATNSKYKNKAGELVEEVEFHNVSAWWKLADIVEKYLHKGNPVFIQWKLKTTSWEDKTGVKKYSTWIVISELQMLWGRPADSAPRAESEPVNPAQQPGGDEYIDINDLPF